jgi:hypothetical protein
LNFEEEKLLKGEGKSAESKENLGKFEESRRTLEKKLQ